MREETDPDVGWVSRLADVSELVASGAVDEARSDRKLLHHLIREHDRERRSSYVEIDAPLELYALVRLLRPRHVVEVGVSSGVSSAYLLAALEKNGAGTLHSVDLPKPDRRSAAARSSSAGSWTIPAGRHSGWAVPTRLRPRWDLRIGDKAEVLPLLAEELPPTGLFVYDVPHNDPAAVGEFRCMDRILDAPAVAIADHGPGGGCCPSLAAWARRRHAQALGRRGTGLYGFRRPG